MTWLWLVTGAALLVALVAWRQARRLSGRVDQISQLYWELAYQQRELRVEMQRITHPTARDTEPSSESVPPQAAPTQGFVPLSSLTRSRKSPTPPVDTTIVAGVVSCAGLMPWFVRLGGTWS